MLENVNRQIVTGSNEKDDIFDANKQALYLGGQGNDKFSNQSIAGLVEEGGGAWFVGGSGNDTYRATLDTITVVQEEGDSPDDQWFDVSGRPNGSVVAVEVDGRHLLLNETESGTNLSSAILFVDWRDPENRIETWNLFSPESGYRSLSFSQFENAVEQSPVFLGYAPLESIPTLTQQEVEGFKKEIEAVSDVSRNFEETGNISDNNQMPAATDDTITTTLDRPITVDVLANDNDADGDTLSINSAGNPSNGTVSITNADEIRYMPDAGFTGMDSFSYTISDPESGTSTANIRVTIEEDDQGPMTSNTFKFESALAFDPSRSIPNVEGDLTIGEIINDITDSNQGSTGSIPLSGTVTFNEQPDILGQGYYNSATIISKAIENLELTLGNQSVEANIGQLNKFSEDSFNTAGINSETYSMGFGRERAIENYPSLEGELVNSANLALFLDNSESTVTLSNDETSTSQSDVVSLAIGDTPEVAEFSGLRSDLFDDFGIFEIFLNIGIPQDGIDLSSKPENFGFLEQEILPSSQVEIGLGTSDFDGAFFYLNGTVDQVDPVSDSENSLSSPQVSVFFNSDGDFTVADPAEVFGRGGDSTETLRITETASNVQVDGNVERIEVADNLGNTTFQVIDGQLTLSADDTPVVQFTGGLNQSVELGFANGNTTLEQTGAAVFSLSGPGGEVSIGESPVTPSVGLNGSADIAVGSVDDGSIISNANGDTTFDFSGGDYGVKIDGFSNGDVLDFADVAGDTEAIFNVLPDTDQADGEQVVSFGDPATTETVEVTLSGLTADQDNSVFNQSSFKGTFGDGALVA